MCISGVKDETMKITKKRIGWILLGFILVMQFFPPAFNNPPVTVKFIVPDHIQEILETSCYDCHSNETKYPWYSKIFPGSYLIAHDVNEGREELNFSEWTYAPKKAKHKLNEIREEAVDESKMPPWFYVALHPEASLSDEEKSALRAWLHSLDE